VIGALSLKVRFLSTLIVIGACVNNLHGTITCIVYCAMQSRFRQNFRSVYSALFLFWMSPFLLIPALVLKLFQRNPTSKRDTTTN